MEHFLPGEYTYQTFEFYIRRHFRYCHHDHVTKFLDAVIATSESRKTTWPAKTELVRAQIGCQVLTDRNEWADSPSGLADQDMKCKPYEKARMKPLSWKAKEGRANPRGIPCLYLATNPHTAMSEVLPWKGCKITLATFETVKELTLVDCSKGYAPLSKYIKGSGPKPFSLDESNWRFIDNAYSCPVDRSDEIADYAPTQVLAETFRLHGYHGLIYHSDLSDVGKDGGKNVALFELAYADIAGECTLHRTTASQYRFSELMPDQYGGF